MKRPPSATSKTPALIIYLLDVSKSMNEQLDGRPKIDHVSEALKGILGTMVKRSTKGEVISKRYRIAMCAYSEAPHDILGGVISIDELALKGYPQLTAQSSTNAASAFRWARDLLRHELPKTKECPAPLVCHLTDGAHTGEDPAPIAGEIMQMSNDDGNVLIENIYVGPALTAKPLGDARQWPGLFSVDEIVNPHAAHLFEMSSRLPETYAALLAEEGYNMKPGCHMLIPGTNQELIRLAFTMSGVTH